MRSPTHLSLRVALCLSALLLQAGCSSSDARARDALNAYQAAAASNDVVGARKALLELVQAKDDVSDYWVELGKLEASTGDFNDAYYAYSRAYELDRTNVDILRSVTELALRAGDLPSAQSHAEELSVLAPGDPWPKLVSGWSAVRESHFDQAITAADALLANNPYDPSATVLKARALIGLNREDDAVELLSKQVQAQPEDRRSLQLLARIYRRRSDWPKLLTVTQRLAQLTPADRENALLMIEAAFRSGNSSAGREASLKLLQPNAEPSLIASVLALWHDYWPSAQRISDARTLAAAATGLRQKLAYASFLSDAGSPSDAIRLSSNGAQLPVNAGNAEANAVLADGWTRMGNFAAAKARFNAVLAFDSGNATALRGRAELELRTDETAAAATDAEKLVTVLPTSSRDRLLLARAYAAAGNRPWADRTLWRAFEDIPADEKIFAALLQMKSGNNEATHELQEEFDRQRDQKLSRGLL